MTGNVAVQFAWNRLENTTNKIMGVSPGSLLQDIYLMVLWVESHWPSLLACFLRDDRAWFAVIFALNLPCNSFD